MSKKKHSSDYVNDEFAEFVNTAVPKIPSRCSNVLVHRYRHEDFQGKVLGYARNSNGTIEYILVDPNSAWKSAEWIHVSYVYEVE